MDEESEMMMQQHEMDDMEYGDDMDGHHMMGDMDGMDGDEYDMEEDMDGMHHHQMHDMEDMEGMEYDQETPRDSDEDLSLNFDQDPNYQGLPPLDKMRKVRREVLKTINEFREHAGLGQIYTDKFTNSAANEYARFLLTNEHSQEALKKNSEKFMIDGEKQHALIGFAHLDDDKTSTDMTKQAEFLDAHGLLLELQKDLAQLMNKDYTHVGIGFAADKDMVKIVELLSSRHVMISQLGLLDSGEVCVEGQVLHGTEVGIYAAKIVSQSNPEKMVALAGPQNIQYDKTSCRFLITFEPIQEDVFNNSNDPKMLEIYVRKSQIDKIKYQDPTMKKLNARDFQALENALRVPMEIMPDPRILKEDAVDQDRFERDMKEQAERAAEEKKIREEQERHKKLEKEKKRQAKEEADQAEKTGKGSDDDDDEQGSDFGGSGSEELNSQKKLKSGSVGKNTSKAGKSFGGGSEDDLGDDMDDGADDEDYDKSVADLPPQPVMKKELIQAILDEIEDFNSLKARNEELQRDIIAYEFSTKDADKSTDQMLHEHKYLNTLANVHQVRYNLKETQERYNKMASELQNKLNEKQQKCMEIETQFKELKKSVAQNAQFNRTGKKLLPKQIKEWEDADEAKDQQVNQYRLQNIALRNQLANKQKILRKKEQLADGLHLIDYEQLKIENQTLNEKIEERNTELHKLKAKISRNVIILSHTREKYRDIVIQNEEKQKELEKLSSQLKEVKKHLSNLKGERDKLEKGNLKLKQQTAIVRKGSLKQEFTNRVQTVKTLKEENMELAEKHEHLLQLIREARIEEQKQQYEMQ